MSIARITIVALAALTLASCMRTPNAARLDPPSAPPGRILPAQNTIPEPLTSQSADDAIPAPAQSEEISARTPSPHRDRSR